MKTAATTCQICGRGIKASKGLIAHHGYERPGQGWQTSSCFGARWSPYEVACDALPPAIKSCEGYIAQATASKNLMMTMPPETMTIEPRKPWIGHVKQEPKIVERPEGFVAGKRPGSWMPGTYEAAFWGQVGGYEYSIKQAQASLEHMQKRLEAWKAPAGVETI